MSDSQITVEVSSAGIALEASFVAGSTQPAGAVIAPPHPLYGGTLGNPVVAAARDAFIQLGCANLSFNFRGTEGSTGTKTDNLEAAVADYRACLDALSARVTGPMFAAGYSFGAGTALLSALEDTRVRDLVLLAPPVGMLRAEDLVAFRGRVLVVIGDDDEYAPLPALQNVLSARQDIVLEVITGADHFFHYGGLSEISQLIVRHVRGWL